MFCFVVGSSYLYHFVVKQLKTKTQIEQPQIQDNMDISQPDVTAAGSVVVANALHLGEQGVGSEVYIQTHTKLLSVTWWVCRRQK